MKTYNIKDKGFWEDFKSDKFAINCETIEEFKQLLIECDNKGLVWCTETKVKEDIEKRWTPYEQNTCLSYSTTNHLQYASVRYFTNMGIKIIKFKDLSNHSNEDEIKRISKEQYYMNIARAVSKRSTCIRRQYGAVIVKDDRIVSTGYNGNPKGEENCIDVGKCYRIDNNIPHGTRYENCKAVHAEQNAIINAQESLKGSTLYLYGEENGKEIEAIPCSICSNMIKNAGIEKVINTIF